jgi:RNA polymerase sigma-70 factor (ECF subfamily)
MSRTEDRFALLLLPHLDGLYRLAARLAPRREDAETLLEDALAALFARRAELSSIRDLGPYLARVLYLCFASDRRRYGRARLELVAPGRTRGDGRVAAGDALSEDARIDASLERALARLSEDHRVALVLADAEGYSATTIECITDVPADEIDARILAARARVRALLREDGVLFVAADDHPPKGGRRDAL